MNWIHPRPAFRRAIGAVVALFSIAVVVFLTAQAIDRSEQQARESARYKHELADLQVKYDKLQRDQHALVKLLKAQGKTVPPEVVQPSYVPPSASDGNDDKQQTRITERSTRVEIKPAPTSKPTKAAPSPTQTPDEKPVVKVPDLPDVGKTTKDLLKGTPLDGLM